MRYVIRTVLISLGCFTVACLPARQVAAELPPEIMADKYLVHAEQLHAAKDYAGAFEVMEKIIALQKEHNLKLPDEFHFKYAHVALSADSTRIALESVSKYLSATGKEGKFYNEALALLLKAEGHEVMSEEDFYNDVIKTQGTCKELLPIGSGCWMELTNHPECYVWNDRYSEGETVVWAGKCSGHVPDGKGTLTWYYIYKDKDEKRKYEEHTGHFQKGKEHGQWVYRYWWYDRGLKKDIVEGPYRVTKGSYVDGKKQGHWASTVVPSNVDWVSFSGYEGPYVDDKKHGHWVNRHQNGNLSSEGPYVEGKRHGHWVSHYQNGNVQTEVSYVEGKRHGHWVSHYQNGNVYTEGPYVEGKRHGHWVSHYQNGNVSTEGPYVDGEKHGQWVFFRGTVKSEVPYVEGKMHGRWLGLYPNGTVQAEGSYVDGKKDGQWVYRDPKGTEWGGSYVEGKKHGHWVENRSPDSSDNQDYDYEGKFFYYRYGNSYFSYSSYQVSDYVYGQGAYLDDVRNGEWVLRFSDGKKRKGVYQDGKKEGTWLRYDPNEKRCWSMTYRQGRRVNSEKVKKKICQQAAW